MKKENKEIKKIKLGRLALLQIFILILGTIAISYAIGSEVKVVSAAVEGGVVEAITLTEVEPAAIPIPTTTGTLGVAEAVVETEGKPAGTPAN